MKSENRVAIVTGANRGIGFEVCRQLGRLGNQVILTSRDPAKGQTAAQALIDEGLPVVSHPLDVTDETSIQALHEFVVERFSHLDILVNNAGIYLRDEDNGAMTLAMDTVRQTLETNTLGALRMCQVFIPRMKENGYGRVVNVSSGVVQHVYIGKMAAYRLSKAGLNLLTQMIAASNLKRDVLVNCCSPGWVRTDMGGQEAPLSPEQGSDTIVWLATLPEGGPSGEFFENRKRVDW